MEEYFYHVSDTIPSNFSFRNWKEPLTFSFWFYSIFHLHATVLFLFFKYDLNCGKMNKIEAGPVGKDVQPRSLESIARIPKKNWQVFFNLRVFKEFPQYLCQKSADFVKIWTL